jgi:hypothetical protein
MDDHDAQRLNRLHWARGAILVAHHVRAGESLNTLANRFCDGNTDYAWRNVAMLLRLVAREATLRAGCPECHFYDAHGNTV